MSDIQKSVNLCIKDLDSSFKDLLCAVENQFDELIGIIEEKDEEITELQTEIEQLKEELRKAAFLLIEYQHQNK